MTEIRPPALTKSARAEIEGLLKVGRGVTDRLKGDPKSDDFNRVRVAGMEALVDIVKIDSDYRMRFYQATEQRDTSLMLAAVYGLHVDLYGTPKAGDRDFMKGFLNRAANVITENKVQTWIDDYGISMAGSIQRRRALIEYMTEKLAVLDAIVAEAYPDAKAEPELEKAGTAPGM